MLLLTLRRVNKLALCLLFAQSAIADNASVDVVGSNNEVYIQQLNAGKTAAVKIFGNYNDININQKDTGQHQLDVTLNGDSHTATFMQEGTGNHQATVELSNQGGAWTFNLNQSGATGQTYSVDAVTGTCYTAAGCNLTVHQQ